MKLKKPAKRVYVKDNRRNRIAELNLKQTITKRGARSKNADTDHGELNIICLLIDILFLDRIVRKK